MEHFITLKASDGHELTAYWAEMEHAPRGGVVVIQEIFGVNDHIRAVCDRFADAGYSAVAPALFDRVAPGVELAYDGDGTDRGRALRAELGWDAPLLDIQAAVDFVKSEGIAHLGCVGFCWGGSLAWLAASRVSGLDCAVGYYGGQIAQFLKEDLKCPVILHFGQDDPLIPMEDVAAVRDAYPDVPVHLYDAGHGFNCDQRDSYAPEAADMAWGRTMDLMTKNVG